MALLALILMALLAGAPQAAQAAKRQIPTWSHVYGALYPGRVFFGEPYELPAGWRAYPVSIFNDVYVIYPVRTTKRVNFTSRRATGKPRAKYRAHRRK